MSGLYLVKDGKRTVTLAAEQDGKLYAFVPNVSSFVYNKPMSVDFQIDRELTYERVSNETAASVVREGSIGKIDESKNKFLLDHMRAETRRINPSEILGADATADSSTPAQVANAIADVLRKMPLGSWMPYKVYPRELWRQALRRATDLSTGRVQAFSGIPLISRVTSSTDDDQIVEISRTSVSTKARTAPRKAVTKVTAKKAGGKVALKAVRGKAALRTKAGTRAGAKSR